MWHSTKIKLRSLQPQFECLCCRLATEFVSIRNQLEQIKMKKKHFEVEKPLNMASLLMESVSSQLQQSSDRIYRVSGGCVTA